MIFPITFENEKINDKQRSEIKNLIDQNLVMANPSEEGDLLMLKYSRTAFYDYNWNNMLCNLRGLLVDKNIENVLGRGFVKFFNVSEHDHNLELPALPIKEKVNVTKKMDGSLGLIVNLNGKSVVFTSGSAKRNEIAEKGQEILERLAPDFVVPKGYTLLAEIISPINRIVVDYHNAERLVGLALVKNDTGEVLPREKLIKVCPFEVVEEVAHEVSFQQALNMPIPEDEEGYVLEFVESGVRAKLKGEVYLAAHRLMTNMTFNRYAIMLDKGELEAEVEKLKKLPITKDIIIEVNQIIEQETMDFLTNLQKTVEKDYDLSRKDFAIKYRQELPSKEFSFAMRLYVDHEINDKIKKDATIMLLRAKEPASIFSLLTEEEIEEADDDYA